ncbi:aminotransferase class I/II-fold pyridoxal phosphate-dependent enzyme [Amycolatopsis sp. NPDC021455]|uniref:aminotransferase class I/II-fold pyridoxal phosphate-dependent enzyme n=1 Tax=Amycolatopsis sp. NPDC021455 TaxID=3154901 RepID=UPI00340C64BE
MVDPVTPAPRIRHTLSLDENPYPPPDAVRSAIVGSIGRLNWHPDPTCEQLVGEIARLHRVPADHVVVGHGRHALLVQLAQSLVDGEPVRLVHAEDSLDSAAGHRLPDAVVPVAVPLGDPAGDLPAAFTEAAAGGPAVILLGNPSTPSGTTITQECLERFLEGLPAGVVVVLDESYRDFATNAHVASGIPLYAGRPGVAVLRSLSATYGLAGLNIGYLIARAELTDRLHPFAAPFPISTVAQCAARAALRAQGEHGQRISKIVGERARLVTGLHRSGVPAVPSQANFVFLPLAERSTEFASACQRGGVDVRLFPRRGVRVTVGTPEANDAFLRVATVFAGSGQFPGTGLDRQSSEV